MIRELVAELREVRGIEEDLHGHLAIPAAPGQGKRQLVEDPVHHGPHGARGLLDLLDGEVLANGQGQGDQLLIQGRLERDGDRGQLGQVLFQALHVGLVLTLAEGAALGLTGGEALFVGPAGDLLGLPLCFLEPVDDALLDGHIGSRVIAQLRGHGALALLEGVRGLEGVHGKIREGPQARVLEVLGPDEPLTGHDGALAR